jgi:hypothetical protein
MVMVMKNWLGDVKVDCSWEGDSFDDFFKEKASIIEKNYTTLDVAGYFNIDELERWMSMLMGIGFAVCRIAKLSYLMTRYIS